MLVLGRCPFAWVAPFAHLSKEQRAKDEPYQEFKAKARDALMRDGFRKVFPHLEKHLVRTTVGTPLSTNHFLATEHGEVFGAAGLNEPKRWMARDLSPWTALPNFFLTGQDVVTLGVPGALSVGYLTACAMEGYGDVPNLILQREIMDDLPADPVSYTHLTLPTILRV